MVSLWRCHQGLQGKGSQAGGSLKVSPIFAKASSTGQQKMSTCYSLRSNVQNTINPDGRGEHQWVKGDFANPLQQLLRRVQTMLDESVCSVVDNSSVGYVVAWYSDKRLKKLCGVMLDLES